MGMPPSLSVLDLACVQVEAQHIVAHFRKTGAGDEAHIAGTDDGDFHGNRFLNLIIPVSAWMCCNASSGSAACVMGRPTTGNSIPDAVRQRESGRATGRPGWRLRAGCRA